MSGVVKSSTDGTTGLTAATNPGQPVPASGDEYGRAYVRPFADGAPISTANPMPVAFNGSSESEVEGNVANDVADSGNPVKIGARATGVNGVTAVAVGDRVDAAGDVNGRLQVTLSGANRWTKYSSLLAVPAASWVVTAVPCVVGRLSITLIEATDMYVLVYDGVVLVDRFFIPAGGTAVRDYTTEGGLLCSTAGGLNVALSTVASALAAPTGGGGFLHAIYQTL